jgi:hypothetical protein
MKYYNIARYIISLSDFPSNMILDRFDEFNCLKSEPHMCFKIRSIKFEDLQRVPDNAEILVKSPTCMTYRYDGSTYIFYTPDDAITCVKVNNDYSECSFSLTPAYLDSSADPELGMHACNEAMINIRKILTGRLALDKGICIHSCVVDYNGHGILFSAVTETGKSTHAHLWQEVFPETEIINGDNGFCRIIDDLPIVFGTPWCGDSNEYMNKSVPIKAIVFLEQAQKNSIESLNELDSFLHLAARCYMPFWDRELVIKALDTVEHLTQKVGCYLLKCLPNRDAVKVVEHELFRS